MAGSSPPKRSNLLAYPIKRTIRHIFLFGERLRGAHANSKSPTQKSDDYLLTMQSETSNITDNAVSSEACAIPDARRYLLDAMALRRRTGSLSRLNELMADPYCPTQSPQNLVAAVGIADALQLSSASYAAPS